MINCNNCKNVNMNEDEQKKLPYSEPHFCKVYGERLFHNTSRLGYHSKLYPCTKCVADNYINFKERE